jgi:hypothetical protein
LGQREFRKGIEKLFGQREILYGREFLGQRNSLGDREIL